MQKSTIIKNLVSNPFVKGFILISLKETYFFLRNLYGLVFHPFKTVLGILQKPDKSQTLLVFGLPGYLWLLFLFLFIPVFWFFRDYYEVRMILLLLFYSFSFLVFLFGCYLLYWLAQYFYRCKLKPKH